MTLSAVAVDFDQALDVETFNAAQIAFYLQPAFLNFFTQAAHFVFSEVLNATIFGDAHFLANLGGGGAANSVHVRQGDVRALVSRKIHSGYSGHLLSNSYSDFSTLPRSKSAAQRLLSLALLMFGIFANDGDPTFAADHFAFFTNFLY
jgi:hypothetical protein